MKKANTIVIVVGWLIFFWGGGGRQNVNSVCAHEHAVYRRMIATEFAWNEKPRYRDNGRLPLSRELNHVAYSSKRVLPQVIISIFFF